MGTIVKFISDHRLAVALAIVGILYLGIPVFYATKSSDCPSTLPDIPIYPAAQNIQMSNPMGVSEKYEPSSTEITFTTTDRPLKIEVWYLGAMKREGWHYDACRLFQKRGCGWYGPYYYGILSTETTENGQTRATLRISGGHFSCDMGWRLERSECYSPGNIRTSISTCVPPEEAGKAVTSSM